MKQRNIDPPFDSIFIEHARRRSLPLAKKTNEDETTTRSTFFSSQVAIESTGLEPITLETRPRIFQRSRKWEKIGRRRVKTNFHIVDSNGNSLPTYKGKFCGHESDELRTRLSSNGTVDTHCSPLSTWTFARVLTINSMKVSRWTFGQIFGIGRRKRKELDQSSNE